MPVMDGLQETKLIRTFEETGNCDAARSSGIEESLPDPDYECYVPFTKRVPIVAVSTYYFVSCNSFKCDYSLSRL